MSIYLNDVATKGADYHRIISGINKYEAINLIQNIDLTKKAEHYKT